MGHLRLPDPVLLVVAVFSRHEEALEWATRRLVEAYGPVALASTPFDFNQTRYYEASMGTRLRKQFLAFAKLIALDALPEVKNRTNALEEEMAQAEAFPEARPLNLDPGLLTLGKFMLATTKDQAHRIYLGQGIFAEVTLRFHDGAFEPWPWTYADYRQPAVLDFLRDARDLYRQRLRETMND